MTVPGTSEGSRWCTSAWPATSRCPADYDGDGNADRAVYRTVRGTSKAMPTVYFGLAGDIPVPGDYNGDGDTERAIYRNGAWYVQGMPTVFLRPGRRRAGSR